MILQDATDLRDFLVSRILKKGEDINFFLNPDYELNHNPFLFSDMYKAVERIFAAINNNEKIAVYADFDADGIPGAIILEKFFNSINVNIRVYIPHRDKEGYGFHKQAIDTLKQENISLIITVDVGSSATDAILYAKDNKIDVIVTDHHNTNTDNDVSKDCFAMINPKKYGENYPFRDLSGAGVAFKLVQALIQYGKSKKHKNFLSYKDGMEKWLLDLVAISTLSDQVPLTGENRIFAKWGLFVLNKSIRPGLREFFRFKKGKINEDDIYFSLTPRINAASRMGDPMLAYNLLSTNSYKKAKQIIKQLDALNRKRQAKTNAITKEIKKRLLQFDKINNIIVLGDADYPPSLCGLVANKISEEFNKTTCIWGKDSNGKLKGSCRSIGDIRIPELLKKASDVLDEFGGHDFAGGFSIKPERLHLLDEKLNSFYEEVKITQQTNKKEKIKIPFSLLDESLKVLEEFAPFGMENEKPEFFFDKVQVSSVRNFGSGKHLELLLTDGNLQARAFEFFTNKTKENISDFVSFYGFVQNGFLIPEKAEIKINLFDI